MSDFFQDDFTAELKAYFLQNLTLEADRFLDLIDDSSWRKIQGEVNAQVLNWSLDAKSNDFLNLAHWLEIFPEITHKIEDANELKNSLLVLKSYTSELIDLKSDSDQLAEKFSLTQRQFKKNLYLHCKWLEFEFALPLLKVVEISGHLPMVRLPDSKSRLSGVLPFRGDAIPVLNWVHFGLGENQNSNYFYVICEVQNKPVAIQVTSTDNMVELLEKEIISVESQSLLKSRSLGENYFIKNNHNILILDLEKMVS